VATKFWRGGLEVMWIRASEWLEVNVKWNRKEGYKDSMCH
jgi:hypothetical protein